MDAPPGFDTGSPYARKNYANYVVISNGHEKYIFRLMRDYIAKETDILQVYTKKAAGRTSEPGTSRTAHTRKAMEERPRPRRAWGLLR